MEKFRTSDSCTAASRFTNVGDERFVKDRAPGEQKRPGNLNFLKPCLKKFPCLALAYESLKIQKSAPAVLNASNEIAVDAFLNSRINFLSIPKIVEKTLNKTSFYDLNSIKEVIEVDKDARRYAEDLVKTGSY